MNRSDLEMVTTDSYDSAESQPKRFAVGGRVEDLVEDEQMIDNLIGQEVAPVELSDAVVLSRGPNAKLRSLLQENRSILCSLINNTLASNQTVTDEALMGVSEGEDTPRAWISQEVREQKASPPVSEAPASAEQYFDVIFDALQRQVGRCEASSSEATMENLPSSRVGLQAEFPKAAVMVDAAAAASFTRPFFHGSTRNQSGDTLSRDISVDPTASTLHVFASFPSSHDVRLTTAEVLFHQSRRRFLAIDMGLLAVGLIFLIVAWSVRSLELLFWALSLVTRYAPVLVFVLMSIRLTSRTEEICRGILREDRTIAEVERQWQPKILFYTNMLTRVIGAWCALSILLEIILGISYSATNHRPLWVVLSLVAVSSFIQGVVPFIFEEPREEAERTVRMLELSFRLHAPLSQASLETCSVKPKALSLMVDKALVLTDRPQAYFNCLLHINSGVATLHLASGTVIGPLEIQAVTASTMTSFVDASGREWRCQFRRLTGADKLGADLLERGATFLLMPQAPLFSHTQDSITISIGFRMKLVDVALTDSSISLQLQRLIDSRDLQMDITLPKPIVPESSVLSQTVTFTRTTSVAPFMPGTHPVCLDITLRKLVSGDDHVWRNFCHQNGKYWERAMRCPNVEAIQFYREDSEIGKLLKLLPRHAEDDISVSLEQPGLPPGSLVLRNYFSETQIFRQGSVYQSYFAFPGSEMEVRIEQSVVRDDLVITRLSLWRQKVIYLREIMENKSNWSEQLTSQFWLRFLLQVAYAEATDKFPFKRRVHRLFAQHQVTSTLIHSTAESFLRFMTGDDVESSHRLFWWRLLPPCGGITFLNMATGGYKITSLLVPTLNDLAHCLHSGLTAFHSDSSQLPKITGFGCVPVRGSQVKLGGVEGTEFVRRWTALNKINLELSPLSGRLGSGVGQVNYRLSLTPGWSGDTSFICLDSHVVDVLSGQRIKAVPFEATDQTPVVLHSALHKMKALLITLHSIESPANYRVTREMVVGRSFETDLIRSKGELDFLRASTVGFYTAESAALETSMMMGARTANSSLEIRSESLSNRSPLRHMVMEKKSRTPPEQHALYNLDDSEETPLQSDPLVTRLESVEDSVIAPLESLQSLNFDEGMLPDDESTASESQIGAVFSYFKHGRTLCVWVDFFEPKGTLRRVDIVVSYEVSKDTESPREQENQLFRWRGHVTDFEKSKVACTALGFACILAKVELPLPLSTANGSVPTLLTIPEADMRPFYQSALSHRYRQSLPDLFSRVSCYPPGVEMGSRVAVVSFCPLLSRNGTIVIAHSTTGRALVRHLRKPTIAEQITELHLVISQFQSLPFETPSARLPSLKPFTNPENAEAAVAIVNQWAVQDGIHAPASALTLAVRTHGRPRPASVGVDADIFRDAVRVCIRLVVFVSGGSPRPVYSLPLSASALTELPRVYSSAVCIARAVHRRWAEDKSEGEISRAASMVEVSRQSSLLL